MAKFKEGFPREIPNPKGKAKDTLKMAGDTCRESTGGGKVEMGSAEKKGK
jgi:hypothetical protein